MKLNLFSLYQLNSYISYSLLLTFHTFLFHSIINSNNSRSNRINEAKWNGVRENFVLLNGISLAGFICSLMWVMTAEPHLPRIHFTSAILQLLSLRPACPFSLLVRQLTSASHQLTSLHPLAMKLMLFLL